jgi:hypothetical protein
MKVFFPRYHNNWQVFGIVTSILVIMVLSCQTLSTPTAVPPQPTAVPPTPTTAPAAFVPGECDPSAQPIEMNTSYNNHITGGPYPETCPMYCLWTPKGSQLKIGIKDFSINLDMYVDQNLSVTESGDFGQWYSHNASETGSEEVTIDNPDGRYYIQVCAYSPNLSDETNFTLYSNFTP